MWASGWGSKKSEDKKKSEDQKKFFRGSKKQKEGRKETLRTQMLPEKMRKIMAKNSNKKYQVGYRIGFRNNVTIQASQLV